MKQILQILQTEEQQHIHLLQALTIQRLVQQLHLLMVRVQLLTHHLARLLEIDVFLDRLLHLRHRARQISTQQIRLELDLEMGVITQTDRPGQELT